MAISLREAMHFFPYFFAAPVANRRGSTLQRMPHFWCTNTRGRYESAFDSNGLCWKLLDLAATTVYIYIFI